MKPSREVLEEWGRAEKQCPKLKEYLASWKAYELSRLPIAEKRIEMAQGRCQVLEEVNELFNSSTPRRS